MPLISPGFAFLLLPVAAALYHCLPTQAKRFGLLAFSVGFFLLMEPTFAPLALLSLLLDALAAALLPRLSPGAARAAVGLAVAKSLGLVGFFCLYLPMAAGQAVPVGLAAVGLTTSIALVDRLRGGEPLSPLGLVNGALFFGKLPFGPVTTDPALLRPGFAPTASLSQVARGAMRFVLGLAKRVILAEHLTALLKTLSRLPTEQITLASAWLTVLCAALCVYFTLSAFSDMAVGLGEIFSLELPRLVYYPFLAPCLRDYIDRFNLPLSRGLARLLFGPDFDRDAGGWKSYLLSALAALSLALWLSPSRPLLEWGLWLVAMLLLDFLLLRHIPLHWNVLSRAMTFLLLLPSFALLVSADGAYKLALLTALTGQGVTPYNEVVLYLLASNLPLLLLALVGSVSAADTLSRLTRGQFPRLWWCCSLLLYAGLLVVTLSFLLWNVT